MGYEIENREDDRFFHHRFPASRPSGRRQSELRGRNRKATHAGRDDERGEKLSQHFNFIRVDFYTDDKIVKVGEITNCDNAGLNTYLPKGADVMFSKLLFNP